MYFYGEGSKGTFRGFPLPNELVRIVRDYLGSSVMVSNITAVKIAKRSQHFGAGRSGKTYAWSGLVVLRSPLAMFGTSVIMVQRLPCSVSSSGFLVRGHHLGGRLTADESWSQYFEPCHFRESVTIPSKTSFFHLLKYRSEKNPNR